MATKPTAFRIDLQRALINDLHAYLKSKGKETIVWEGPPLGEGDNKVNTEVIHLNWRTIDFPADQMLAAGYRVVNAAWDPLYIVDHYPRNNFTMASPQYIYETLRLTKFQHFNPGMPTFAKPVESQRSDRLIGFCMPWWEGRDENYAADVLSSRDPDGRDRMEPRSIAGLPGVRSEIRGYGSRPPASVLSRGDCLRRIGSPGRRSLP